VSFLVAIFVLDYLKLEALKYFDKVYRSYRVPTDYSLFYWKHTERSSGNQTPVLNALLSAEKLQFNNSGLPTSFCAKRPLHGFHAEPSSSLFRNYLFALLCERHNYVGGEIK
jgi:hypothetical protein